MAIRQYQSIFPALAPVSPPAAPPSNSFLGNLDPMVKVIAPIAALAATFSVFVPLPPPPVQVGLQQTYQVQPFKTVVVPEFSQAQRQFVVVQPPVVVQQTDWLPNFKPFVTDQLPLALPTLAGQVQVPVFYHDWEYAFPKPYPIAVHLELSPFIPPGINLPPASPITGGDGPPWHLTPTELAHLKKYHQDLARLQQQFDKRHRESVAQILRDVEIAAYGEPEPEAVEQIEKAILALPQLPKKSFFNVDLKSLKAQVERDRAARELAEDEEDVQMILKVMFS